MASPTLAFRVGVFAGLIFVAVAVIALALAALFFIGLTTIPPASLAMGVLVLITLTVAVALALAFAASVVAVGLLALAIFVIVAVVVSPLVAVLGVILFLVLLGLSLAMIGNPLSIPLGLLLLLLFLVPIGALVAGIIGPGTILIVIAVLGFVVLALAVAWLVFFVHPLPLRLLGLGGLRSMPAVPVAPVQELVDAAFKLRGKEAQREVPIDAMTNVFTLGAGTPHARTATARAFLFKGRKATQYSLDDPRQFSMGWTTFTQVDSRAAPLAGEFAAALDVTAPPADATKAATAEFWPNIGRYWNPFGIVPIAKVVTPAEITRLRGLLGSAWVSTTMDPLIASGTLYVIDMTIFARLDPPSSAAPRFTPATIAFFTLDTTTAPLKPTFVPFLIQVSDGANTQVYTLPTAGGTTFTAWIYALQALKVATTVWGIWLGHVYRYHMVTAAMQMTMFDQLPPLHGVRRVLGLQSKYLIGFDTVLLLDWSFPPPTSCTTSIQFLQLVDAFAAGPSLAPGPTLVPGRPFFADDPETDLATLGLPKASFSNPLFRFQDVDLPAFAAQLNAARVGTPVTDPVSVRVLAALAPTTTPLLVAYGGGEDPALQSALVADLNALIAGPPLTAVVTGAGVALTTDTAAAVVALAAFVAASPGAPLPASLTIPLNRMLLQDRYRVGLWIMQWNLYPIAHYVVSIYRAAARYVGAVVAALYPTPASVSADAALARWISASTTVGRIQGLPAGASLTPAQLTAVLTSLIYRITAHGLARLAPVGNPGLTWVGNFPPCLEDSRIPDPRDPTGTGATPPAELTQAQLLAFMPKTGTIGEMISFVFSFGFTDNFEPLIPAPSANTTGLPNLELTPFIGLPPACNAALGTYRAEITGFIRYFLADANVLNMPARMTFSATQAAIHQWEMNIEQ